MIMNSSGGNPRDLQRALRGLRRRRPEHRMATERVERRVQACEGDQP